MARSNHFKLEQKWVQGKIESDDELFKALDEIDKISDQDLVTETTSEDVRLPYGIAPAHRRRRSKWRRA